MALHISSQEINAKLYVPWWQFLRQGNYRYVNTLVPDEIEEGYDLETDPHELKNLALDPVNRGKLDAYRKRLLGEFQRTAAGPIFTPPEPCRFLNASSPFSLSLLASSTLPDLPSRPRSAAW